MRYRRETIYGNSLSAAVTSDMRAEVEAEAEAEGIPVGAVVRHCIDDAHATEVGISPQEHRALSDCLMSLALMRSVAGVNAEMDRKIGERTAQGLAACSPRRKGGPANAKGAAHGTPRTAPLPLLSTPREGNRHHQAQGDLAPTDYPIVATVSLFPVLC